MAGVGLVGRMAVQARPVAGWLAAVQDSDRVVSLAAAFAVAQGLGQAALLQVVPSIAVGSIASEETPCQLLVWSVPAWRGSHYCCSVH